METPFGVWLPQVSILRCRRFEDAITAVDSVRARHCVVLQLETLSPREAQRIVDFVAGALEALNGRIERISDDSFVCTPQGVELSRG